jgi:hypothetical protein
VVQNLSVEELQSLYDRLIGPHPQYAYVAVSLSLRLEIIETAREAK